MSQGDSLSAYGEVTHGLPWRSAPTSVKYRKHLIYIVAHEKLLAFINSPEAFIPPEWPSWLKPLWGLAFPPTARDTVNFPWTKAAKNKAPFAVAVFRGFCMGMADTLIADWLSITVGDARRLIHEGLNWHLAQSEFLFWAVGADPIQYRLPEFLGTTLTERHFAYEKLRLSIAIRHCPIRDKVVADPVYIHYARTTGGGGDRLPGCAESIYSYFNCYVEP